MHLVIYYLSMQSIMFLLICPLKQLCLLFDIANYASDWKKIKDFQKKKKAPHCPDFNICLLLSRRSRYYGPGLSEAGMPGVSCPPPIFYRSGNPNSTRGNRLCQQHYYCPPPDFQTFLRPCYGPGRGHRVQACTVMNIRLLSHGKTKAYYVF